jgi:hypothetical protein
MIIRATIPFSFDTETGSLRPRPAMVRRAAVMTMDENMSNLLVDLSEDKSRSQEKELTVCPLYQRLAT